MKITARLLFLVGILLFLMGVYLIPSPLFSIIFMFAGGILLAIAEYKSFNWANTKFRKPKPNDW